MELEFAHTCNIIDNFISKVKEQTLVNIGRIVDDANPLISKDNKMVIINNSFNTIFFLFEEEAEGLRTCNSEMRNAADYQLSVLDESNKALKVRISELKNEVADLQSEIAYLK